MAIAAKATASNCAKVATADGPGSRANSLPAPRPWPHVQGIERLILEAKEGLALSNGINLMAAAGALAVHDAESLLAPRRSARR